MIGDVSVEDLTVGCSDHHPISFHTREFNPFQRRTKEGFLFEAMWFKEAKSKQIIQQVWDRQGTHQNRLSICREKLNQCKAKLIFWNTRHVGNITTEINRKMERLKWLHSQEGSDNSLKNQETE